MRVNDLSKELNISNKELIGILEQKGITGKYHSSGLTDEEEKIVRETIKAAQNPQTEEEPKEEARIIIRRRKKASEPQEEKPAPQAEAPSEKKSPTVQHAPAREEKTVQEVETLAPEQIQEQDKQEKEEIKSTQAPQKKKKEPRVQKQQPEAAPQARIISRPAPIVREEKKETEPEPVIQPMPGHKPAHAPKEDFLKKELDKEEGGPKKKKSKGMRKKDKRIVEAADLYHDDAEEVQDLWSEKDSEASERNQPRKKPARRSKPAKKQVKEQAPVTQPLRASKRKIRMEDHIRIGDLAQELGVRAQEIIKLLFGMGVMATINQSIDVETASLIAVEYDFEVESFSFNEESFLLTQEPDTEEQLKPRPPVVTIMGHVDHGKTSLLDAIRQSSVTAGEAGGITQHIGAYHVQTSRGEIVFLDTPGHEAFTAMRMRGAQITDLVILVVAADDGVMEQTREAVSHSKAAGVPIVVAVNKIDKEGANPDRVKRELAELGLTPEEWGGETIFSEVSAKARIGLDDLLELVALQAEVLDLKANPDKRALGHIIEAKLDKGRGPVATVLVQEGTLHQGDAFVCGVHSGKLRALFSDQGKKIKHAGPSIPVEVLGMEGVPDAGDEFVVVADEKIARKIAETRHSKQRAKALAAESKVTLETFLASKADGEVKTLNLVLKTDVFGSQGAIIDSLNKLSTDEVKVNIVHAGTGAIREADILLAAASGAILIGFNVRPTAKVKEIAEQEQVEIRFYDIIYKLIGEIKDAMAGMLAPIISEQYLGQATVLEIFSVPRIGTIAGCMVNDGKLKRNAGVRLLREGVVIYTGKLSSLKRFKDDAREVAKGFECGAGLEKFNDIKVGDIIDAFEEKEEKATLD